MNTHLLDNPAWHALVGPHAGLALGAGAARHYPRDIAPYSAIAEPTPTAYADLAADLPPGLEARLFRPREECAPPGWETRSAEKYRSCMFTRITRPQCCTHGLASASAESFGCFFGVGARGADADKHDGGQSCASCCGNGRT